jgi:hypothetical protein
MYIFSRRVTARPDQLAQGLAAAVEIGQKASTVAGRPIGVYHARFGAPMGSILYSTRVETMAELEAMTNKMSADKKYAEWIAPMRAMFTPPEDAVVSIISSSITAPGARYVSGTMAIPANGKVAAAVEFGVKVQSHMSNAGFKSALRGTAVADRTRFLGRARQIERVLRHRPGVRGVPCRSRHAFRRGLGNQHPCREDRLIDDQTPTGGGLSAVLRFGGSDHTERVRCAALLPNSPVPTGYSDRLLRPAVDEHVDRILAGAGQ